MTGFSPCELATYTVSRILLPEIHERYQIKEKEGTQIQLMTLKNKKIKWKLKIKISRHIKVYLVRQFPLLKI
jgi:hypothetical protein